MGSPKAQVEMVSRHGPKVRAVEGLPELGSRQPMGSPEEGSRCWSGHLRCGSPEAMRRVVGTSRRQRQAAGTAQAVVGSREVGSRQMMGSMEAGAAEWALESGRTGGEHRRVGGPEVEHGVTGGRGDGPEAV